MISKNLSSYDKPFLEVLQSYYPHLDENPYYYSKEKPSLFYSAVSRYLVHDRDEQLAMGVIDLLLESGIDPSIQGHPQGKGFTPLALAEASGEKDLVNHLLNKAIEAPSFESVAFENKFTDFLKKIPGGASKVAEKVIGGVVKAAGAVTGQNKKLKEANKTAKEVGQMYNKEAQPATGDLQTDYDNLTTDSEKELYLIENLPQVINSTSRGILAKALVKDKRPFSSDLYKVIEDSKTDISKEVAGLLTNSKFSELPRLLKQYGLKGIKELNSEEALQQLKIIAFFAYKDWNTSSLRVRGTNQWKTLGTMKGVVNQVGSQDLKEPSWKQISPKDIQTYIKKLTGQDPGEISDIKALSEFFEAVNLKLDLKKVTLPKLRNFRKYPDGTNINKIMQNEKRRLEK